MRWAASHTGFLGQAIWEHDQDVERLVDGLRRGGPVPPEWPSLTLWDPHNEVVPSMGHNMNALLRYSMHIGCIWRDVFQTEARAHNLPSDPDHVPHYDMHMDDDPNLCWVVPRPPQ